MMPTDIGSTILTTLQTFQMATCSAAYLTESRTWGCIGLTRLSWGCSQATRLSFSWACMLARSPTGGVQCGPDRNSMAYGHHE
eukprot:scaffold295512_cov20-Prasinocladus_malaysianus.AAC.1